MFPCSKGHLVRAFPLRYYLNDFNQTIKDQSEYFCKSLFRLKGLFNGKAPHHPDCFGNLVTPQVVLTTLKCFIRVKDVREYYEIPQKSKTIRGKVIYNHDLDPAEIIIAQVLIAKRDKVKFPLK